MESHSKLLFLVAAVVLAGCAARATLPPVDADHPASPDAPEAAVMEPSPLLDESAASAGDEAAGAHRDHSMHGGNAHEGSER